MANTITTNKLFQEPALGDTGWNTPLNFNFTTMDQSLGSSFAITTTGGTTALASNTAAINNVYWWTAQQLVVSGTLTSNATITIPTYITGSTANTFGGSWIITNNTTGSYTLTFKTDGTGASGSGVTISQNSSAYVYSNGTSTFYADSNITNALINPTFTNVTITGTESVAGAATFSSTAAFAGVTTVGLPSPQTVTITIASPAQITATTVPVVNTPVVFTTTGALPTGITAGTTYYVVAPTATTFNIAASAGGSAINTSGTQSGVQTATFSSQFADALNISSNSKLSLNLPNIAETATVSATAATGTINFDVLTQSVTYYTTAASGDWTLNVRGNSLTTLNSLLGIGQSLTLAFLAQNQNIAAVTATISIATPAVITITGTLPSNGTPVTFSSTGALPTGITSGTTYYVINASGSTFNISATVGGSAIATSGTQSGTQTVTYSGLFNNVFQIDGTTVTPKWQGGSAPTYGNNGAIDVYTYTIIKTASSTYTVLASITPFK
jgi:hypothetical protein